MLSIAVQLLLLFLQLFLRRVQLFLRRVQLFGFVIELLFGFNILGIFLLLQKADGNLDITEVGIITPGRLCWLCFQRFRRGNDSRDQIIAVLVAYADRNGISC